MANGGGPDRRSLAAIAMSLLVASCDSAEGPGSATGSDDGEGVCAKCVVAGGETSDFGSTEGPTPCELSEVPVAISEAQARRLGFGETLKLFERSFSESWAWTATEVAETIGPPPTGYDATSEVTVETSVSSIRHLVPVLEGCADRLSVVLDVSLETSDGSISIAGKVHTYAGRNLENNAFGRLDLANAEGSLRVSPPDWPAEWPEWREPTSGYLAVLLKFWPDTVRGAGYIQLTSSGDDLEDDLFWGYRPLDARFPVDTCEYHVRSRVADEPSPVLAGQSVAELQSQLVSQLEPQQPSPATWRDGSQTAITVELGEPSRICEATEFGYIEYSIPVAVTTDDGRVQVEEQFGGSMVAQSDGTLRQAMIGIGSDGGVPAASFASTSGISGVDLTGLSGARWHLSMELVGPRTPHGELVVEGIDSENKLTRVLEELTWRFE